MADLVNDTLRLVAGLQGMRLVAGNIDVTDDGVKLEQVTLWDPPALDLAAKSEDELDGHGEAP